MTVRPVANLSGDDAVSDNLMATSRNVALSLSFGA